MDPVFYTQLLCQLISEFGHASESFNLFARLSDSDWKNFLRFVNQHGLTPVVFDRLTQYKTHLSPPDDIFAAMQKIYLSTAVKNTQLLNEAKRFLSASRDSGLPVIGLKGIFLVENVFGNIALRVMSDMDFLVQRKDVPAAQNVLKTLGYEQRTYFDSEDPNTDAKHASPMVNPYGCYAEIHWSIVDDEWPFNIDTDGLWERAVPAKIAGLDVLSLSIEDLILHLCIHYTYQHLLKEGGLRGLFDLLAVMETYQNEIDWRLLAERANQWGVGRIVALTFQLVSELFCQKIPSGDLENLNFEPVPSDLLSAAKDQIIPIQEVNIPITYSLISFFSKTGLISKLKLFFQRIFLPKAIMARYYNVSPTSIKVYLLYPVRWYYLFLKYGKTVWKILFKQETESSVAGYVQTNQRLLTWMESE